MRIITAIFLAIAGAGASALPIPFVPASANLRPEITLKAEAIAEPGDLVVLEPDEAQTQNARVVWNLNHPGDFKQWREENGKLFVAMPPHQVSFSLIVIPFDEKQVLRNIRHVLNVRETEKTVVDKFQKSDFLVLIENAQERPPALAKMINSRFWQTEMADAGFNQILIHDDESDEGKAFIDTAKKLNQTFDLPFFAIMDAEGNFKESFNVPDDLAKLRGVLGL